jgi:hypothetical protein
MKRGNVVLRRKTNVIIIVTVLIYSFIWSVISLFDYLSSYVLGEFLLQYIFEMLEF